MCLDILFSRSFQACLYICYGFTEWYGAFGQSGICICYLEKIVIDCGKLQVLSVFCCFQKFSILLYRVEENDYPGPIVRNSEEKIVMVSLSFQILWLNHKHY
jgi:hypothetical protein